MDLNLTKHKEELIFLPLGGSNEIGMNLNLYHLDGKWIMVDCGVGFADNVPGISMMTPDISFIKTHRKNLLGIILTHIHEDHLGAVQYLIQELDVPIYATLLASNFLKSKLSEFRLDKTTDIRIIDVDKHLKIGSFDIEFIGLTHSVPEMQALMIRTRKANILHTGDWKFDETPVVGNVSEKDKIREYGDKGEISAIICDSTNALNQGHSRSEGDLHESLKSLIAGRQGYVGITTFASNIARIHTIAKIAKEVGRKVVLAGWSLNRIYEVAKKSGYFTEDYADKSNFVSDREVKFFKKNEILVIATGCQGEEMAATKKIADHRHPTIKFRKGDLMIFSSKIIPGNEKKIFGLFDALAKQNVDVMTEQDHFVHVSGHPSRDELREIYALAKPKIAIPVHGEFIHTKANCDLAKECGVETTFQIENGLAIRISDENGKAICENIGFVKSGYFGVDGNQLINLNSNLIAERRKLQESGIIFVSLCVNDFLEILTKPKINCVGSYNINENNEDEKFVVDEIRKILKAKARELNLENSKGFNFLKKKNSNKKLRETKVLKDIEKNIRSRILKIIEEISGKRPAVEILLHLV